MEVGDRRAKHRASHIFIGVDPSRGGNDAFHFKNSIERSFPMTFSYLVFCVC